MKKAEKTLESITAPKGWAFLMVALTLFVFFLMRGRLIEIWVPFLRGEWTSVPDPGGGLFLTSCLLFLVVTSWVVICRSSLHLNERGIEWLSLTARRRRISWSDITHVDDLIPKAEINWHMGKVLIHHGGKKTKVSGLLFGDKARHVWSILASNVPVTATVSPEEGVLAALKRGSESEGDSNSK